MKIKIALATMLLFHGCNKPRETKAKEVAENDYLEEFYKSEEVRYEEYLDKLAG